VQDLISRQAALYAIYGICNEPVAWLIRAAREIEKLPSVQPEPSEITDEQAILHLQSTGWMQNHDREMYESGLREQLADDSLVSCEDAISRQAAIDAMCAACWDWCDEGVCKRVSAIQEIPSAQPTLCGYDIKHLMLIAEVMRKENLPPERVTEALMDIGRIVSIVRDEFEEMLRKAVEQCMI
jgi:hypothetical protein